jgi:glycerol-1-phosphate dehydrogenase [NAD(P)+]
MFMVVITPIYGSDLIVPLLNTLPSYCLITQELPWNLWNRYLSIKPKAVIYNTSMEESHLIELLLQYQQLRTQCETIIGFGGGLVCDTAKYFAWKWQKPLILIPSIISVDAFLCPAIATRDHNRVQYIGQKSPDKLIIDYKVIRSAPPTLNYSGIGDVLSCCTALGDWIIGRDLFQDPFDLDVFNQSKQLIGNVMRLASKIHDLTDEGIRLLVEFLREEVHLCDIFGSARPEEGSEHFLAYTLESLYPKSYLHGALVSLNVLTTLKLQGEYAQYSLELVKNCLDTIGVNYNLNSLTISSEQYKNALQNVSAYTKQEKLFHGLWYLDNPFRRNSINNVIDWIQTFKSPIR